MFYIFNVPVDIYILLPAFILSLFYSRIDRGYGTALMKECAKVWNHNGGRIRQ